MSIRIKIGLLIIAVMAAFWIAGTYLISKNDTELVNKLEADAVIRQVVKVQQEIAGWQGDIEMLCNDWTAHFRSPPSEDPSQSLLWIKKHLGSTLETRGMHFAAVFTPDGKIDFLLQRFLGGILREDISTQYSQYIQTAYDFAARSKDASSGLLYTPGGIMLFAAQKIASGPHANEIFLIGVLLDEARLKSLRDTLQINAQILPVGPDSISKIPQKDMAKDKRPWFQFQQGGITISGYVILRDPEGLPVGMVEVNQPCRLKQASDFYLSKLYATLGGIALILAVFTILLIDLSVFRRICKLSRASRDASPDDLRALPRSFFRSRDEVGSLARVIRTMVERLYDSQSRYRAVVETQTELIVRFQPDGNLTFVNDAFADFFGGSLASFEGRNYFLLLPEEIRASEREHLSQLTRRKRHLKREVRLLASNGSAHWLEWNQRAILNDEKDVVEIQCVGWDITERREFAEKLTLAKEEAEMANRAKSEFLAVISHEIRTPLNSIMGFSSVVQQLVQEEQAHDCLRQIEDSGRLLLRIFDDIFEFASTESQHQNLEEGEFSLRDCLLSSVAQSKRDAEHKGLQYEVEIAPGTPEIVMADSHRLQRVLSILADNAVKFTEKGGVTIRAALGETIAANKATILFEVRDTGIGVTPKARQHIFTPFLQADSSTTRLYGGLGLGLALCKRLVTIMGGEIMMESQLGAGSVFHVIIPVTIVENIPVAS